MKCSYHPQKDAVSKCSLCEKPLCTECAGFEEKGDVVCSRCSILSAARDAAQGIGEREEEREERMQARGRKKSRVSLIFILALTVVVVAVNLYFYLSIDAPGATEFDPNKNSALTAVLINDAIQDYARDHKEQFPEKLSDLLNTMDMPSDKITPEVLKKFSYIRFSPHTYEFRLKGSDDGTVSDLVFTQEEGR